MHAKFTWDSCVQKTSVVYILYNQNKTAAKGKNNQKEIKNGNSKSIFYLARWTDFTPDNIFVSYCYNKCFHLLMRIKEPMLMP